MTQFLARKNSEKVIYDDGTAQHLSQVSTVQALQELRTSLHCIVKHYAFHSTCVQSFY